MLLNQQKVLKNLDKELKIASKNATEALKEIGERGVGILKSNTPVDEGRLRGSMSYTIDSKTVAPLGPKESGDKLPTISQDDVVVIGTNVIYAANVEFLSNNGSQGFMLRSYKQLKGTAEAIMKSVFKRKGY